MTAPLCDRSRSTKKYAIKVSLTKLSTTYPGNTALSQDSPTIEEILVTVKEFAEGVASRSAGAERYDALCAAFLLGVVQRELRLGTQQDEEQIAALNKLVARGESGGSSERSITDLYKGFCEGVRGGRYDDKWASAFDFALRQVIDKVLVTNADHLQTKHRV